MLEPEREFPLAVARHLIETQLNAHSLNVHSSWHGHPVQIARVHLDGPNGQHSQGCGKGHPEQAGVGALFEAFEHFLDAHATRPHLLRSSDVLRQSPFMQQDVMYPWLVAQPGRQLACQAYHDYSGHWLFDYPLRLTCPDLKQPLSQADTFDYRGLARYSANDGSAIGASRDEAILHALNQRIERDALSLFLLRHYYYERQDPVRWVEKPDPTTTLGTFWRQAEETLQAPIHVLDISNEFASRTFLALRMDDLGKPHGMLFGVGASLDPWHAVHRAVSELVQLQVNGQEPELISEQQLAERHLRPFPRLHRCVELSLLPLIQAPQVTYTLPSRPARASVKVQVRHLLADVQRHGHSVGICEVFTGEHNICLVNVVIPGLEVFHIVTTGNVVCPSPRGATLDPKSTASAHRA